jgi:hypothetical protein
MPRLPKDWWVKLLLAGGLLLVFCTGLLRLPEVESRLSPERFWNREISRTLEDLALAEMNLELREATQEAVRKGLAKGFPRLPGALRPTEGGARQALERLTSKDYYYRERVHELEIMLQRWQKAKAEALGKK